MGAFLDFFLRNFKVEMVVFAICVAVSVALVVQKIPQAAIPVRTATPVSVQPAPTVMPQECVRFVESLPGWIRDWQPAIHIGNKEKFDDHMRIVRTKMDHCKNWVVKAHGLGIVDQIHDLEQRFAHLSTPPAVAAVHQPTQTPSSCPNTFAEWQWWAQPWQELAPRPDRNREYPADAALWWSKIDQCRNTWAASQLTEARQMMHTLAMKFQISPLQQQCDDDAAQYQEAFSKTWPKRLQMTLMGNGDAAVAQSEYMQTRTQWAQKQEMCARMVPGWVAPFGHDVEDLAMKQDCDTRANNYGRAFDKMRGMSEANRNIWLAANFEPNWQQFTANFAGLKHKCGQWVMGWTTASKP